MPNEFSQNIQDQQTFSGTGLAILETDVVNREFLNVEVSGVNAGNKLNVEARLNDGSWVPIWTILGNMPVRSVSIGSFDDIRIDCETFDSGGSGTITVSVHDTGHDQAARMREIVLVEGGITYTAKSLQDDRGITDPVWSIKREYTSGSGTFKDVADNLHFTQALSDRNSIFPPAVLINNKSLLFDGVDEYLQIPTNPAIDFDANSQAGSISVWHKRNAPGAAFESIFANLTLATSPAIPGIAFFGDSSTLSLLVISDNSTTNVMNKTYPGITDSNWHHYCVTFDGSGTAAGLKYYLDGVLQTPGGTVDSLTGSTANGTPWVLGVLASDFVVFPHNGNIDYASFFTIELSQADITALYNDGKPSDVLFLDKVLNDNTVLPGHFLCGDDPADIHPTIVNKGSVGAAIDATMTNTEATDIVEDVP